MRTTCVILLFSLLLVVSSKADSKADYLIISTPHKLSIFNQFEQSLTENEIKKIVPYTPFEIVNRKESLGDQITEAIRCKFGGATYFLLLDSKGNLKSAAPSLYQKTFQKCIILNDTVQLKRSVKIFEKYPSSGSVINCKPDQSVMRVFQYSTYFYVFVPEKNQYGWVSNGSAIFRTIAKATHETAVFDITNIVDLVQARLTAANDTYEKYFEFFDTLTQQQKTVPQWKLENDGKRLHCVLSSPAHIIGQLKQSTHYVVQDIEQMLLGKPFIVQYTSGEIIINPR